MSKQEYSAKSIKALSDREYLLKRPSLTFGDENSDEENPYSSQKSVAIREIIDNSTDEVQGGHANKIKVSFLKDGCVEVSDNGRGIPPDIGEDAEGNPATGMYLAIGIIKSGGKFETDSSRQSAGLNGVGASSTVQMCSRADVIVYRDNKKHTLSFKDGVAGFYEGDGIDAKFRKAKNNSELLVEKDTRSKAEKAEQPTGTVMRVWINDDVFESEYPFDRLDIAERIKETAFVVDGLKAEVYNEVDLVQNQNGESIPRRESFDFPEGLKGLVELSSSGDQLFDFPILSSVGTFSEKVSVLKDKKVTIQTVERVLPLKFTMSYSSTSDEYTMKSYVNAIRTNLGGSHVSAFEKAMTEVFPERFKKTKGLVPASMNFTFDDFKDGLTVALSVRISEPQFTGQEKARLGRKAVVAKCIQNEIHGLLKQWANNPANEQAVKTIAQKAVINATARLKQKEEKELKKATVKGTGPVSLPSKLVDCLNIGTEDSELYIIEGDSAKGALKGARYASHQALLPIRGKIINAFKQNMKKVLTNQETQDIIQSLNAGMGKDFNLEKARYKHIFLATDADPDGGAISLLLLVLLWVVARQMILEGRVWQLCTPLFVIKESATVRHYAMNDKEKEAIIAKLDKANKKYFVSRIKGLGEAGNTILRETGMNPETRTVKRIVVEDVEKAFEMLNISMGKDVEIRKEWIEKKKREG